MTNSGALTLDRGKIYLMRGSNVTILDNHDQSHSGGSCICWEEEEVQTALRFGPKPLDGLQRNLYQWY